MDSKARMIQRYGPRLEYFDDDDDVATTAKQYSSTPISVVVLPSPPDPSKPPTNNPLNPALHPPHSPLHRLPPHPKPALLLRRALPPLQPVQFASRTVQRLLGRGARSEYA